MRGGFGEAVAGCWPASPPPVYRQRRSSRCKHSSAIGSGRSRSSVSRLSRSSRWPGRGKCSLACALPVECQTGLVRPAHYDRRFRSPAGSARIGTAFDLEERLKKRSSRRAGGAEHPALDLDDDWKGRAQGVQSCGRDVHEARTRIRCRGRVARSMRRGSRYPHCAVSRCPRNPCGCCTSSASRA